MKKGIVVICTVIMSLATASLFAAQKTNPAPAAALSNKAPEGAACVGWQGSLSQGRRVDEVESCLRAKALSDRPTAVAEARQLATWDIQDRPYTQLLPLVAALSQFPEPTDLKQFLSELGLLPNKPGEYSRLHIALTAADYLSELGNIYWFDAETGTFPNNHDYLMAEVAALSDLKDAKFTEVAPSDYRNDEEPYTLKAEIGGKHFEQRAENYGDWYDIEAVISLLNRIAHAEKLNSRFSALPTSDQTAIIWVADQSALLTLHERKLMTFIDAEMSMLTGKAFEEQVKESLLNQTK